MVHIVLDVFIYLRYSQTPFEIAMFSAVLKFCSLSAALMLTGSQMHGAL